jgi:hypothetical protein|nr:MAG TPA: hypothetical protein [Caudoviricetes sp.]
MNREELQKEKEALETARMNILEGGQEFQTRDGRVKMASLETIMQRLSEVNSALNQIDSVNGMTDTVRLKFGGMG